VGFAFGVKNRTYPATVEFDFEDPIQWVFLQTVIDDLVGLDGDVVLTS